MNDVSVTFDARAFYQASEIFKKDVVMARKRGMNKAAQLIRNKTRQLIKGTNPNLDKASTNPKYSDKISDGVMIQRADYNKLVGDDIVSVHVMGKRSSDSGTFRLRFFENGTVDRYTSSYKRKGKNGKVYRVKGHYVGKIKGHNFLKQASQSEMPKAPLMIDNEINKAIDKFNK